MIPYIEQPLLSLGPITIHAFGVIVAVALVAGLEVGRRRFQFLGLDPRVGEGMAWYAIIGGFLGAHLFSLVFYFPEKLAENPLALLKVWEDISSFGSILGGLLGIWAYFRLKAPQLDNASRWSYVDVAAYAFPISLAIGRLACTLAHDHPGTITTFPLAVNLESSTARDFIAGIYQATGRIGELPPAGELARLGFHDLGWYEFLYLALFAVPVIVVLARKPRPAGALLVAFVLLYTPVRFALDFLRVSDVRYAGLTPAQWAAAALLLVVPATWARWRPRLTREPPEANGESPAANH